MRTILIAPVLIGALALPSVARAQRDEVPRGGVQLGGFGGLTFRSFNDSSTFGGTIAAPLTRNIQIIGEAGRMNDVMSAPLATVLDFAPVDLRLRAYYGEAGVRILGGGSVVRPYGEATAGFAKMHLSFSGIGSREDAIINAGLSFLESTQPTLGLGAGVLVQAGPAVVDLGYRYKKIRAGGAIQSALAGGDLGINQFRFGIGVRF